MNAPLSAEQLAEEIALRIESGELVQGAALPSVSELARDKGVSTSVVQQAYNILKTFGMVNGLQGRGTFVQIEPARLRRDSFASYNWLKLHLGRGTDPEALSYVNPPGESPDSDYEADAIVFEATYEEVAASKDLAEQLQVVSGTPLIKRSYRSSLPDQAGQTSLTESYIPKSLIEANPDLLDEANEPFPGATFAQLRSVGIEPGYIEETVVARPPTLNEARDLELDAGVSVLEVEKKTIDTKLRVVEVAHIVLPGNRTKLQFTTPLFRWDGSWPEAQSAPFVAMPEDLPLRPGTLIFDDETDGD